MRTALLIGLPLIHSGPNAGRLDRRAASLVLGITEVQLGKAYNNWIQVFRIPASTLTFNQYLEKMRQAGISPDDVGSVRGKYHLSRYRDKGAYTETNCRFLPMEKNRGEQSSRSFPAAMAAFGHRFRF